jgi:predicted dehydrogenase
MERGIHVYVQKPLTHNIYEARLLTEMARDKKIVSQMGNQGASNPDQLQIQKWIKDDRIGKISKVEVWTNRPVWPQGGKCLHLMQLLSLIRLIGISGLDLLRSLTLFQRCILSIGEDGGILERVL